MMAVPGAEIGDGPCGGEDLDAFVIAKPAEHSFSSFPESCASTGTGAFLFRPDTAKH